MNTKKTSNLLKKAIYTMLISAAIVVISEAKASDTAWIDDILNDPTTFSAFNSEVFQAVDGVDADNLVSQAEFTDLLNGIASDNGYNNPTTDYIATKITALDTDSDGSINLAEFGVFLKEFLIALRDGTIQQNVLGEVPLQSVMLSGALMSAVSIDSGVTAHKLTGKVEHLSGFGKILEKYKSKLIKNKF